MLDEQERQGYPRNAEEFEEGRTGRLHLAESGRDPFGKKSYEMVTFRFLEKYP